MYNDIGSNIEHIWRQRETEGFCIRKYACAKKTAREIRMKVRGVKKISKRFQQKSRSW